MKFYILALVIALTSLYTIPTIAQMNIFAELTGNPVVTTGWNLTGQANIANEEIVLTPNINYKAGSVFYTTPIDFSLGGKFIVDFEFRMFDGSSADGIALNVITQLPTTASDGGGIGVDLNSTGLKIVFDTYDNNVSYDNPEIQVFNGTGYHENNIPSTHKATHQSYLRSPNYQPARFIYDNGTVEVYVNCELKLTVPNVTIQNTGYFGFSAGTGGEKDRHSIKNAKIYTSTNPASTAILNICSGVEKVLGSEPDPEISYLWTPITATDNINLLSDPTIANPTFYMVNNSDTVALQNYLLKTIFNVNGCPSELYDTIKLKIFRNPIIDSIKVDNITSCDSPLSGKATANVSGGTGLLQYQWKDKITDQIKGALLHIPSLSKGKYIFTVTDSVGCIAQEEIEILAPDAPSVLIEADKETICKGDSVYLTAILNGGTAPFSFQWTEEYISTKPNFTVAPQHDITYSVIVQDSKNCKDTVTVPIVVKDTPYTNFSDEKIDGCLPLKVEIENFSLGNIDSCLWIFSNDNHTESVSSLLNNNINHILTTEGCFDITLITYASNGCIGTISKKGVVCPTSCEISAPNVLSIKSAKGNGFWFVENEGYEEFHCEIVNRWGHMVYELNDANQRWDGCDKKGNLLPEGVYFYKITASLNKVSKTKQGIITLIY